MIRNAIALAVLSASIALPTPPVDAKGCLKGAAIGGVAGHVAGHHAVLGAAAGCWYGHHRAKVAARQREAQQRVAAHR